MRKLTRDQLVLIAALLLAGCASTVPRPAPPLAPAGPPPPATAAPDDGIIAMAMDETSDPDVPGGRPDVTSIGDTTIALTNVGYDVVYSETKHNPLVVAYFLRPRLNEDFNIDLCNVGSNFLIDQRTQAQVKHADFTNKGFDRGHMAPNSAIGRRHGCDAQKNTFLLSNIAPQLPGLNQRTWQSYEHVVETDYATDFEGIWVLTGPIFDPDQVVTMCETEIEVPVEFWKIVIRRKPEGELDASGIVMPKDERDEEQIAKFSTTIDDIEARTGIDFFPDLAPMEEQALESACPGDDWMLDTELTVSFPGNPRPICETTPVTRPQSLGTQVGHAPTCAP